MHSDISVRWSRSGAASRAGRSAKAFRDISVRRSRSGAASRAGRNAKAFRSKRARTYVAVYRSGSLLALLLFLAPALSFADACDCWTNRAGHAMKAVPQSLSGQSVTFVQERTGKTVTYPLSVFSETEQERLRCCLKDLTLPEGLKAGHEFAVRVIARSRLLKANGGLTEEECLKAQETAVLAFRAQAASFIAQKQLSQERLELIARELVAPK